jgi:hypothetical protein
MSYEDLYPEYCNHGNPIYYMAFCPGCRAMKEKQQQKRYESYWRKNRIPIEEFFANMFKFFDPSLQAESKLEIRPDDKFATLKKSTSQEELNKNYKKLARRYHPDKPNGSTKMFQKLAQLYELLKLKIPG